MPRLRERSWAVSRDQESSTEDFDRSYLPHVLDPVGPDNPPDALTRQEAKRAREDVVVLKLFKMFLIASYVAASTMCSIALACQMFYLVGIIDF